MNRLDDPVDPRILADGFVLGIDADDLEVLVRAVLVDPVAVEHAQIGAATADTLLGGRAQGALVLELVHTLVRRLAVRGAFRDRLLAASTADADTVDDIALLGLVPEPARLVGAGRSRGAVDDVELAELY